MIFMAQEKKKTGEELKGSKKDKRTKYQIKYSGKLERKVFLRQRIFIVNEGDKFDVSKDEVESFKDKEQFKQVK